MGEWPQAHMGDLLEMIIDHRGKTPKKLGSDWTQSGHRVISAINIKDSYVDDNDHHYVDDETYVRWMKTPLKTGDVILTSEAPLGEVAFISEDVDWVLGQRVFGLRANTSRLTAKFLFYFLQTETAQALLEGRSTGTTVTGIKQRELVKIEVPTPPLSEQEAIADVLGALDDKIFSNQITSFKSDELITALYQKVRSGASGEDGLSNWASTQYGLTLSGGTAGSHRLIRVTDINKKPWIQHESAPFVAPTARDICKYELHPGDIVVARMADPGKVGYFDEGLPCSVFASYLVRVKPNDPSLSLYMYYFLRSEEYLRYSEMMGGGSVQKNMNARVITGVNFPVPNAENLIAFNESATRLRSLIGKCRDERQKLLELRAVLLPRLMDGSLGVRTAEELVRSTV